MHIRSLTRGRGVLHLRMGSSIRTSYAHTHTPHITQHRALQQFSEVVIRALHWSAAPVNEHDRAPTYGGPPSIGPVSPSPSFSGCASECPLAWPWQCRPSLPPPVSSSITPSVTPADGSCACTGDSTHNITKAHTQLAEHKLR